MRAKSRILSALGVIIAVAVLVAACETKRSGRHPKDGAPGSAASRDLSKIPDAVPRVEPIRAANSRPYTVNGKTYIPRTRVEPFSQHGTASWYGRQFHGRTTAGGERYDMYAMTAAHPTLPIPSYARVTSLENGRSVVVRINDRGPFQRGRVIDLSYVAARKLGFIDKGTAKVKVEQIVPVSR